MGVRDCSLWRSTGSTQAKPCQQDWVTSVAFTTTTTTGSFATTFSVGRCVWRYLDPRSVASWPAVPVNLGSEGRAPPCQNTLRIPGKEDSNCRCSRGRRSCLHIQQRQSDILSIWRLSCWCLDSSSLTPLWIRSFTWTDPRILVACKDLDLLSIFWDASGAPPNSQLHQSHGLSTS